MPKDLDIYFFFEYRELLKALFEKKKAHCPGYSYRVLAQKAGFKSAGFFSKILSGKTNISAKTLEGLAKAFQLNRPQTEYFELLVGYQQARVHAEKKLYFEKILNVRRGQIKTLEKEQFELFDNWYVSVIRELLDFMRVKDDFNELACSLIPPIRSSEAKKAVGILSRLGVIKKNPDGYWRKVDAVVSTSDTWTSLAVESFQRAMIHRAEESIESTKREQRDISTLTISISRDSLPRVREILKESRRQILEIARRDHRADRVYQLNLQLFPLSKTEKS